MKPVHSKLTAQGQISVPAEVRRRLGVGPGSVLEWDDRNGSMVVRKAGRYNLADVHEALFGGAAPAPAPVDVKEGIRKHIRKRHAGG